MSVVKGLWIGEELGKIERLCIKSFQKQGHIFELFTYGKVKGIPEKTIIRDGNEILEEKEIFKYDESYLPFSDLFRYKMLYDEGGTWVDMDMICIKPLIFHEKFVFSAERTRQKGAYSHHLEEIPSNNILKAPAKSTFYLELFSKCFLNRKNVKKQTYFLTYMKEFIKKYEYEEYVKPYNYFNPVDYWNVKELLCDHAQVFPSKYGTTSYTREEVLNGCYTIHTWRNLIRKRNLDLNQPLSLFSILYNKIM